MNQVSIAGMGLYALVIDGVITLILGWFGITAAPGSIEGVTNAVVVVAGWAFLIWGQLRRKDLKLGIVRK